MADTTDPEAALRARIEQLDEEIASRVEERERVERALAVLTECKQRASTGSMSVTQAMRVSYSKGKSDDDLVMVASDAGLTLRDLAKRVRCSGPLISQARKGHRSISKALAERIQFETKSSKHPDGFAATMTNWPKLRS